MSAAFNLYILRHAEAGYDAPTDEMRELTEKGQAQARKVGRFCAHHGIVPGLLLTSPLRRAEQTARLAAAEMSGLAVEVAHFLAAGMHPEVAVEELRAYRSHQGVMIVGHEPDLSSLVLHLLAAGGGFRVRKASLTLIELPAFRAGAGTLQFSLPVKFL